MGWEKGLSTTDLAKIQVFNVMQGWTYRRKIEHAERIANTFFEECERRGLNCHVSVGWLDSITLLLFLRDLGIDCPAISISSLEDQSIQRVHKQLGVIRLHPSAREDGRPWTKAAILQEFGFPVISKEKAAKIELLQNPTDKTRPCVMRSLPARPANTAETVPAHGCSFLFLILPVRLKAE